MPNIVVVLAVVETPFYFTFEVNYRSFSQAFRKAFHVYTPSLLDVVRCPTGNWFQFKFDSMVGCTASLEAWQVGVIVVLRWGCSFWLRLEALLVRNTLHASVAFENEEFIRSWTF